MRARVSYGLAAGGALRADAGAGRGCRRRRGRLLKVRPVVEPCVQACGSTARSWYSHAVRSGTSRGWRAHRAQSAGRRPNALDTCSANVRLVPRSQHTCQHSCTPATRAASASSSPPLDAASGGGTKRAVGCDCTGCARHRQLSNSTAVGPRSIPWRRHTASGAPRGAVLARTCTLWQR